MNTEDQERLKQSVNDIAAILYRNTPPEQVTTLKGIETAMEITWEERRLVTYSIGIAPATPLPVIPNTNNQAEPVVDQKKPDYQSELLNAMLGTISIMAFGVIGIVFLRKWLRN
jgi:hypothetical protein